MINTVADYNNDGLPKTWQQNMYGKNNITFNLNYFFDISLTFINNNYEFLNVTTPLTDRFGNSQTKIINSTGKMRLQVAKDTAMNYTTSNLMNRTSYNPYTIKLESDGYKTLTYQYNITTPEEWVIELEEDTMAWIPIIMALSVMTGIFLFASINIKDRRLDGMKALLWLLSITNALMIGATTYIISLHPTDASQFEPIGLGYLTFSGAAFIAILYMYAKFLIERVAERTKEL